MHSLGPKSSTPNAQALGKTREMETHIRVKLAPKSTRFSSENDVLLTAFLLVSFDNMIGQLLQKVVDSERSCK
jgi:hypothetical protein